MDGERTRPTTRSRTIADLLPRAADMFGGRVAARYKSGGRWHDLTFAEVADRARAVAGGLVDMGVAPGDRVAVLCSTRPEWAYCDFGIAMAGAVTVPIYPTSSPEECAFVLADSGAVAIVCEGDRELARVAAIRERVPSLRDIVAIEPVEGATTFEELLERGRRREPEEIGARARAVAREDLKTIIYTSGTTGPPKGCLLTHGNYRAGVDTVSARGVLHGQGDLVYLFLPLAHTFALTCQLAAWDVGSAIAYFGGDVNKVIAELSECRPTYLPSVPRIFEKAHRAVTAGVDPALLERATDLGGRVQELRVAGEAIPPELAAAHAEFDDRLFGKVRAHFGGRLREAGTGGAPIAREVLEFFWACGIPVMEGYGMTETAVAVTASRPGQHRFGTVGRPVPGVELRIAPDGEVLVKGPSIFRGYHGRDTETASALSDGWLHTGDLGSLDDDGYLTITGRKKDIIITAGGKNITPANLESELRQSRWISNAVMVGDRRPYPVVLVTLDEEEIVAWARERGIDDASISRLSTHPEVLALVEGELERANAHYAPVEQAKKVAVLDRELTADAGELTVTLKVRRDVVVDHFADVVDRLYERDA